MLQSIKNYAIAIIMGCVLSLFTSLWSSPALAVTNIKLLNLSYKDCPPELAEGTVTRGGSSLAAACYISQEKLRIHQEKWFMMLMFLDAF